ITLSIAALGVALIPLVARPVLHMAARGMDSFALGLLGGARLAIVLLFSLPILLLGTASPWAGRLLLAWGAAQGIQGAQIGTTLGRLSAIGTIGSLLGSFLPVLLLIPAVGTRWTFFILALTLLLVLALGALRQRYVW